MNNIILTSCGIRSEEFKNRFYNVVKKEDLAHKKVLYITTAMDGEDGDKSWVDKEYKTILDLGIIESNITEYKIGSSDFNIDDFDIIYMMGGNTFYLLYMIRKYKFMNKLNKFISLGKIYIGSSAGSEILGSTVKYSESYDENKVNLKNYTGLKFVDGIVIPHAKKRIEVINELKKNGIYNLYILYDGDGIII